MKNNKWMRATSLVTCLFFTVNQFIQAQTFSSGTAAAELKLPALAGLAPSIQIQIPEKIATLDKFQNGQGKLIFHIQNAHGNYQGEKQTEAILEFLKNKYGVDTILAEGAWNKLNPELIRFDADSKKNADILDKLTRNAIVKGFETHLLEHPESAGYGIEEETLYNAGLEAFAKVQVGKSQYANQLAALDKDLEARQTKIFTSDLRSLVKRIEKHRLNDIPFDNYIHELKTLTQKHFHLDLGNADLQTLYPQLVRIYKIEELEKKIDSAQFEKEKTEFLTAVSPYLTDAVKDLQPRRLGRAGTDPYGSLANLLSLKDLSANLPDPATAEFFIQMVQMLPANFKYKQYSNVTSFFGLLILRSEIHADLLMAEVEKLETELMNQLAATEDAKALVTELKSWWMTKKLIALELTPDEYEIIARPEAGVRRPEGIQQSAVNLKQLSTLWSPAASLRPNKALNLLCSDALKFYDIAKQRDTVMLRRIEERLRETKADKVAVITGGFHSGPFADYFKERGYSYAQITPKITEFNLSDRDNYVNVMMTFAKASRTSPIAIKDLEPRILSEGRETSQQMGRLATDPEASSVMHKAGLLPSAPLVLPKFTAATYRATKRNAKTANHAVATTRSEARDSGNFDEETHFLTGMITDSIAPFFDKLFGDGPQAAYRRIHERGGVQTKANADDPVSRFDPALQRIVVTALKGKFPKDGVLGEESGLQDVGARADWQWVVDPIDGTRSFVRVGRLFGTLISLMKRGAIQVAAAYFPRLKLDGKKNASMLTASANKPGVMLNGRLIERAPEDKINASKVIYISATEGREAQRNALKAYFEKRGFDVRDTEGGGAEIAQMMIRGTAHLFIHLSPAVVDMPTVSFMARKLGLEVTDQHGEDIEPIRFGQLRDKLFFDSIVIGTSASHQEAMQAISATADDHEKPFFSPSEIRLLEQNPIEAVRHFRGLLNEAIRTRQDKAQLKIKHAIAVRRLKGRMSQLTAGETQELRERVGHDVEQLLPDGSAETTFDPQGKVFGAFVEMARKNTKEGKSTLAGLGGPPASGKSEGSRKVVVALARALGVPVPLIGEDFFMKQRNLRGAHPLKDKWWWQERDQTLRDLREGRAVLIRGFDDKAGGNPMLMRNEQGELVILIGNRRVTIKYQPASKSFDYRIELAKGDSYVDLTAKADVQNIGIQDSGEITVGLTRLRIYVESNQLVIGYQLTEVAGLDENGEVVKQSRPTLHRLTIEGSKVTGKIDVDLTAHPHLQALAEFEVPLVENPKDPDQLRNSFFLRDFIPAGGPIVFEGHFAFRTGNDTDEGRSDASLFDASFSAEVPHTLRLTRDFFRSQSRGLDALDNAKRFLARFTAEEVFSVPAGRQAGVHQVSFMGLAEALQIMIQYDRERMKHFHSFFDRMGVDVDSFKNGMSLDEWQQAHLVEPALLQLMQGWQDKFVPIESGDPDVEEFLVGGQLIIRVDRGRSSLLPENERQTKLLRSRGGRILGPSSVVDLSSLGYLIIGGSKRKFGKVSVWNTGERVNDYLAALAKSGTPAAEKAAQTVIYQFFEQEQQLHRRGIVDRHPSLSNRRLLPIRGELGVACVSPTQHLLTGRSALDFYQANYPISGSQAGIYLQPELLGQLPEAYRQYYINEVRRRFGAYATFPPEVAMQHFYTTTFEADLPQASRTPNVNIPAHLSNLPGPANATAEGLRNGDVEHPAAFGARYQHMSSLYSHYFMQLVSNIDFTKFKETKGSSPQLFWAAIFMDAYPDRYSGFYTLVKILYDELISNPDLLDEIHDEEALVDFILNIYREPFEKQGAEAPPLSTFSIDSFREFLSVAQSLASSWSVPPPRGKRLTPLRPAKREQEGNWHTFILQVRNLTSGNGTEHRVVSPQLLDLLGKIASMDSAAVRHQYGERLPALMALIAALAPQLLEKVKAWDAEAYARLSTFEKQLPEGADATGWFQDALVQLHPTQTLSGTNTDQFMLISRRFQDTTIIFPIFVGAESQGTDKKWFKVQGDAGLLPGDGQYQIWDYSTTAGHIKVYEAMRSRESLAAEGGWSIGVADFQVLEAVQMPKPNQLAQSILALREPLHAKDHSLEAGFTLGDMLSLPSYTTTLHAARRLLLMGASLGAWTVTPSAVADPQGISIANLQLRFSGFRPETLGIITPGSNQFPYKVEVIDREAYDALLAFLSTPRSGILFDLDGSATATDPKSGGVSPDIQWAHDAIVYFLARLTKEGVRVAPTTNRRGEKAKKYANEIITLADQKRMVSIYFEGGANLAEVDEAGTITDNERFKLEIPFDQKAKVIGILRTQGIVAADGHEHYEFFTSKINIYASEVAKKADFLNTLREALAGQNVLKKDGAGDFSENWLELTILDGGENVISIVPVLAKKNRAVDDLLNRHGLTIANLLVLGDQAQSGGNDEDLLRRGGVTVGNDNPALADLFNPARAVKFFDAMTGLEIPVKGPAAFFWVLLHTKWAKDKAERSEFRTLGQSQVPSQTSVPSELRTNHKSQTPNHAPAKAGAVRSEMRLSNDGIPAIPRMPRWLSSLITAGVLGVAILALAHLRQPKDGKGLPQPVRTEAILLVTGTGSVADSNGTSSNSQPELLEIVAERVDDRFQWERETYTEALKVAIRPDVRGMNPEQANQWVLSALKSLASRIAEWTPRDLPPTAFDVQKLKQWAEETPRKASAGRWTYDEFKDSFRREVLTERAWKPRPETRAPSDVRSEMRGKRNSEMKGGLLQVVAYFFVLNFMFVLGSVLLAVLPLRFHYTTHLMHVSNHGYVDALLFGASVYISIMVTEYLSKCKFFDGSLSHRWKKYLAMLTVFVMGQLHFNYLKYSYLPHLFSRADISFVHYGDDSQVIATGLKGDEIKQLRKILERLPLNALRGFRGIKNYPFGPGRWFRAAEYDNGFIRIMDPATDQWRTYLPHEFAHHVYRRVMSVNERHIWEQWFFEYAESYRQGRTSFDVGNDNYSFENPEECFAEWYQFFLNTDKEAFLVILDHATLPEKKMWLAVTQRFIDKYNGGYGITIYLPSVDFARRERIETSELITLFGDPEEVDAQITVLRRSVLSAIKSVQPLNAVRSEFRKTPESPTSGRRASESARPEIRWTDSRSQRTEKSYEQKITLQKGQPFWFRPENGEWQTITVVAIHGNDVTVELSAYPQGPYLYGKKVPVKVGLPEIKLTATYPDHLAAQFSITDAKVQKYMTDEQQKEFSVIKSQASALLAGQARTQTLRLMIDLASSTQQLRACLLRVIRVEGAVTLVSQLDAFASGEDEQLVLSSEPRTPVQSRVSSHRSVRSEFRTRRRYPGLTQQGEGSRGYAAKPLTSVEKLAKDGEARLGGKPRALTAHELLARDIATKFVNENINIKSRVRERAKIRLALFNGAQKYDKLLRLNKLDFEVSEKMSLIQGAVEQLIFEFLKTNYGRKTSPQVSIKSLRNDLNEEGRKGYAIVFRNSSSGGEADRLPHPKTRRARSEAREDFVGDYDDVSVEDIASFVHQLVGEFRRLYDYDDSEPKPADTVYERMDELSQSLEEQDRNNAHGALYDIFLENEIPLLHAAAALAGLNKLGHIGASQFGDTYINLGGESVIVMNEDDEHYRKIKDPETWPQLAAHLESGYKNQKAAAHALNERLKRYTASITEPNLQEIQAAAARDLQDRMSEADFQSLDDLERLQGDAFPSLNAAIDGLNTAQAKHMLLAVAGIAEITRLGYLEYDDDDYFYTDPENGTTRIFIRNLISVGINEAGLEKLFRHVDAFRKRSEIRLNDDQPLPRKPSVVIHIFSLAAENLSESGRARGALAGIYGPSGSSISEVVKRVLAARGQTLSALKSHDIILTLKQTDRDQIRQPSVGAADKELKRLGSVVSDVAKIEFVSRSEARSDLVVLIERLLATLASSAEIGPLYKWVKEPNAPWKDGDWAPRVVEELKAAFVVGAFTDIPPLLAGLSTKKPVLFLWGKSDLEYVRAAISARALEIANVELAEANPKVLVGRRLRSEQRSIPVVVEAGVPSVGGRRTTRLLASSRQPGVRLLATGRIRRSRRFPNIRAYVETVVWKGGVRSPIVEAGIMGLTTRVAVTTLTAIAENNNVANKPAVKAYRASLATDGIHIGQLSLNEGFVASPSDFHGSNLTELVFVMAATLGNGGSAVIAVDNAGRPESIADLRKIFAREAHRLDLGEIVAHVRIVSGVTEVHQREALNQSVRQGQQGFTLAPSVTVLQRVNAAHAARIFQNEKHRLSAARAVLFAAMHTQDYFDPLVIARMTDIQQRYGLLTDEVVARAMAAAETAMSA